jgi:hypothetical protein
MGWNKGQRGMPLHPPDERVAKSRRDRIEKPYHSFPVTELTFSDRNLHRRPVQGLDDTVVESD